MTSNSLPSEQLAYRDGELWFEDVALAEVAQRFGTPCYVYSRAALTAAYQSFERAFGARSHLICYAVKANSNLAILNLFVRLGSGFDIVSGGELARVLAAGGDPRKVVFSGVGKSAEEMRQGLAAGIRCFNVESAPELRALNEVAIAMGKTAEISLRVNPDVDANTHPYISTGLKENKFGVPFDEALALYTEARDMPGIRIAGIDCHIGSQITEVAPFLDALDKVLGMVDQLAARGIVIRHLDLGGGLGIRYQDEVPPQPEEYVGALLRALEGRPYQIQLEPGRALVGNAGLLLTRVEYLKRGADREFAIVDAAMNDLLRPSLYTAWHDMRAVQPGATLPRRFDIVGPVCETGDFLGHGRELALEPGSLLAVLSAGAYGMAMSSNYNSRPRAAEVMVDRKTLHLIREREAVAQLFALERVLP